MVVDSTDNTEVLFQRKLPNPILALCPFPWISKWFQAKFRPKQFLNEPNNQARKATLVMDGLYYGEAPRIHNQHLYVSDFFGRCVYKIDIETNKQVDKFTFDDDVSGLGWLPDGRMLVSSMVERKVLCFDEETKSCEVYADLSKVTAYKLNDLVVDELGNAYVGSYGFDVEKLTTAQTTTLIRVDTERKIHVESTGMFFPNGSVLTVDGKTLLIHETMSCQVTAFDRDVETGELSNRRIWTKPGALLDGCCLDAEGYLWSAIVQVGAYDTSGCMIRHNEDGIDDILGFNHHGLDGKCVACVLGTLSNGDHILYIVEANTTKESVMKKKKYGTANSRIKAIKVDVGPAKIKEDGRYNAGFW